MTPAAFAQRLRQSSIAEEPTAALTRTRPSGLPDAGKRRRAYYEA